MKKSSILKFTRKCLKEGYKTEVCKEAWMFSPPPELETLYTESFKGEKVFRFPVKRRKTLKRKVQGKVTKAMILEATGPRFAT